MYKLTHLSEISQNIKNINFHNFVSPFDETASNTQKPKQIKHNAGLQRFPIAEVLLLLNQLGYVCEIYVDRKKTIELRCQYNTD